mmetsp:Transcript_30188/g.26739  ORF Transcript_30188/g.26739 Transcript_30188/m.26739 type:complete len:355 (+) Transcript_30188:10-1074(+)
MNKLLLIAFAILLASTSALKMRQETGTSESDTAHVDPTGTSSDTTGVVSDTCENHEDTYLSHDDVECTTTSEWCEDHNSWSEDCPGQRSSSNYCQNHDDQSGTCQYTYIDSENNWDQTCENSWWGDWETGHNGWENDCSSSDGSHGHDFSECTQGNDPWWQECTTSNVWSDAASESEWGQECKGYSSDSSNSNYCESRDGSSNWNWWYADHENNRDDSGSCWSDEDGHQCCSYCSGWTDENDIYQHECYDEGELCEKHHHEEDDEGHGLVENVHHAEEFVDACGCGDHPEWSLPQDEYGFVDLDGDIAHCPTVCWVGDNIIDPLYDHVFVPLDDEHDGGHHEDHHKTESDGIVY